jgi:predicted RNA-binding Zn ribbon-like protein
MSGRRFLWLGNHPALDFLNTEPVRDGAPVDLLATFDDVLAWLRDSELLEPGQAQAAARRWSASRGAERALAEARRLRRVLRQGIERLAHGKPLGTEVLGAINALLRRRVGHAQIFESNGAFQRRFAIELTAPSDALAPLAEAVGDLLCHADLGLVRRCENPRCVLYFYDTSRNHSRRWCSMTMCGNRAKVAAHYQRRRGSKIALP